MYKVFILSVVIALGLSFNTSAQEKIEWLTIEEAFKKNEKQPRKIFIDVYTNWCGWCKRMDKTTFSDEKVAKFVNENFYAVKMNAESQEVINFANSQTTQLNIARSMNVTSYPTIVYMDSDFKTIQPVPGFRTADQFLKILKTFKEKGIKG